MRSFSEENMLNSSCHPLAARSLPVTNRIFRERERAPLSSRLSMLANFAYSILYICITCTNKLHSSSRSDNESHNNFVHRTNNNRVFAFFGKLKTVLATQLASAGYV